MKSNNKRQTFYLAVPLMNYGHRKLKLFIIPTIKAKRKFKENCLNLFCDPKKSYEEQLSIFRKKSLLTHYVLLGNSYRIKQLMKIDCEGPCNYYF